MANIRSQIKRNRQNEKRRLRNKAERSLQKGEARRTREAAESGDVEGAREQFRKAAQAIDRAVSKGVLHKRTAARRKSRLARRLSVRTEPTD